MINFFGIQLNRQEIFIGSCLQFPFIFIVGWWVLLIMPLCGLLWALGGAENSRKEFRRIGVPFVVCLSTFFVLRGWIIFLAIPFMIWLTPSYGKSSYLYIFFLKATKNETKADYLTRACTYILYWATFSIALFFQ